MPLKVYSKNIATKKTLKVFSLNGWGKTKRLNALGNKAISQIKLFRLGYNIPPSLFLDYSFFDYFEKEGSISPILIEMVIKAELGEKLAIRSSSSVEDSANQSFAGFFKTILDVPNDPEKVNHAIAECYRLLQSFQASQPVDEGKLYKDSVRMGIIIQPMIDAKFSGVLFTDSPQNPPNDSYRIEYCWGTGDRLTSSLLTGYSITLDKLSGKIVQQEGDLLLARNDIRTLWKTAANLEKKFHFPQDVEFVISSATNKVVLLQSRPITAFDYTPEYVIQKENEKIREKFMFFMKNYNEYPILSNTNIAELFPNAVPLGFSIFKTVFAGTDRKAGAINIGRRSLGYAPITRKEQTELFLSVGNQPRMNLLIDALTFRLQGLNKRLYLKSAVRKFLDLMRHDVEKANYPEGEIYLQAPSRKECKEYFGRYGSTCFKRYTLFLRKLRMEKIPSILAKIEERLMSNDNYYRRELALLSLSLRRMKPPEVKRKLKEYVEYLRRNLGTQYVIIARIAFLSTFLVKKELSKLSNDDLACLFDSYKNSNSKEISDIVDKTFDLLLAHEDYPRYFGIPNQKDFIEKIGKGETTLDKFLEVFGHIGSLEVMQPRLSETSEEILENLFQAKIYKPQKRSKEELKELTEFYNKYEAWKPIAAREFKKWVKHAKTFMTLRETFKFEFLKITYLIKKIIVEIQTRMGLNELIYYLDLDEFESLEKATLSHHRLLAMQRKAYYEACSLVKIRNVIKDVDDDNVNNKSFSTEASNKNYKSVKGNTIHYGNTEGICLIAKSSQEYYKKLIEYRARGIKDIIGFFKGLELSYCNLMELNGIVTENGGYLAHAATIAREYNIPYISNVSLDHFKDGDYIILDTTNHTVIYKEPP